MFENNNSNITAFVGFIVWKVQYLTTYLREADWEEDQTTWTEYNQILMKANLKTGKGGQKTELTWRSH